MSKRKKIGVSVVERILWLGTILQLRVYSVFFFKKKKDFGIYYQVFGFV